MFLDLSELTYSNLGLLSDTLTWNTLCHKVCRLVSYTYLLKQDLQFCSFVFSYHEHITAHVFTEKTNHQFHKCVSVEQGNKIQAVLHLRGFLRLTKLCKEKTVC